MTIILGVVKLNVNKGEIVTAPLFENYLKVKKELDEKKKELESLQASLYSLFQGELECVDYGKTFSTELSGYKITIIKKESISVDQEMADVIGLGFKKKYTLDKKAYNRLDKEDQKRVDECLTTKPAKPTFKVEVIDED